MSRAPRTRGIVAAHALRQAKERIGLELTETDLAAITELIKNNTADCIDRQSNTRTTWRVEYAGRALYLVYRKNQGVTTFLTREMVEKHGIWNLPPDPTPNCQQMGGES